MKPWIVVIIGGEYIVMARQDDDRPSKYPVIDEASTMNEAHCLAVAYKRMAEIQES